jgi:hypothetical protein
VTNIWKAKSWSKTLPQIWQPKYENLISFGSKPSTSQNHGLTKLWYDKFLEANQPGPNFSIRRAVMRRAYFNPNGTVEQQAHARQRVNTEQSGVNLSLY